MSTGFYSVTVAVYIASLTLVGLCSGQKTDRSLAPPISPFNQLIIWKDLLDETEGKWNDNYPVYRRDFYISSYKRNNKDKSSKILIVGGGESHSHKDTWIYTPWTNSWFQIAVHPRFPSTHATLNEVLPSLCNTFVILIYNVRNVWIFDGSSETWSRYRFDSRLPVEQHEVISKGAVALYSKNCTVRSCRCGGSVLYYGLYQQQYHNFLQIRELRCITQQRQLHCQWVRFVDGLHSSFGYFRMTYYQHEFAYRFLAAADRCRDVIYFSCLAVDISNGYSKYVSVDKFDYRTWRYTRRAISLMSDLEASIGGTTRRQEKVQCNIAVWKSILLLFYNFPYTFAISVEDEKRHFETVFASTPVKDHTEFIYGSGSGSGAEQITQDRQIVFTAPSSEIVRLYWEVNTLIPTVSIYRCRENCSFNDSHGIFPSFSEMKMRPIPMKSPNYLRYHTSIYDYHSQSFYVYGGVQVEEDKNLTITSVGNLWTLAMLSSTRTWWLFKPENTPIAYISSCGASSGSSLVIFGGEYESGDVGNELWLYNKTLRTWKRVSLHKNPWPGARAGCSLTAAPTETEIILFGGYSYAGGIGPEVWSVTIIKDKASWQRMAWSEEDDSKAVPSPRFGHSAVILGNELIIYGGRNILSKGICFSDMWAFNMVSRKWRELIASTGNGPLNMDRNFSVSDPHYCESFMLPYGTTKVVVFQNPNPREKSMDASNSLWMMDVVQNLQTLLLAPRRSVIVQAAGVWDGRLVYFGKYDIRAGYDTEGALIALGQNCKPGTAQQLGPGNGPCDPCPTGWYSQKYFNVSECIECPKGTTTKSPGMYSMAACICDTTHCRHGSCKIVSNDDGEVRPDCTCSFGYAGDRCQETNPVVFVLSFVVTFGVIVVTTALAFCGIRTVRHRRAKQRTERELEETRRAFSIHPREVDLLSRLDEDCPGGYGQVHRATYRDWTVAVKQLQLVMAEWADIRKDFLREIQFMRTIRHPNIVMFMGAGQYDESRPFLVLEFMSGGALHSLLQNSDEELTRGECLQFALNTAEGMNYLHTLHPPRIHRDLKSANLLLSSRRQVKVADFGSARLIPEPGRALTRRQRRKTRSNNERRCSEGLSQHLLSETAELTSRHIGTARWRSPELWRRKSYGTATDVYR